MTEPAAGGSRRRKELEQAGSRGCLGSLAEGVGEIVFYIVAAGLAGILVVVVRAFDLLLQRNRIVGLMLLATWGAAFTYGVFWTARVGPGLYLENLKDTKAQARLGAERRGIRIAAMVFVQVTIALAVGYGVTVAIWGRP